MEWRRTEIDGSTEIEEATEEKRAQQEEGDGEGKEENSREKGEEIEKGNMKLWERSRGQRGRKECRIVFTHKWKISVC